MRDVDARTQPDLAAVEASAMVALTNCDTAAWAARSWLRTMRRAQDGVLAGLQTTEPLDRLAFHAAMFAAFYIYRLRQEWRKARTLIRGAGLEWRR